jgi:N-acetylmuramoyl-L-alanine amidase
MDTPKLIPLSGGSEQNFARNIEELELDALARTVWGEARGEGSSGMQAVAFVILNRVSHAQKMGGYWWGNTILEVCHKPFQFSCWNKEDPNYRKLLSVDEKEDIYFATARRVCARAKLGFLKDPTCGATHYHTRGISPKWAKDKKPCALIGKHIFYKLVED